MKISNSKKQLAAIIHENGGWPRDAEYSAQDGSDGQVSFYKSGAPVYNKFSKIWNAPGSCVHMYGSRIEGLGCVGVIKDFHQTILSRDEYFHLHPAPDDDGWIKWNGGERPVGGDTVVEIKTRDGEIQIDQAYAWNWSHERDSPVKDRQITAYRLHKPEKAKPEFYESVVRSIPEPETKPTIEQLAAEYRNLLEFARRKQEEADDAKADADEALRKLELAGDAIGLVVTPITAKQELELVIADWRDLRVGDEVALTTPNGGGVNVGEVGAIRRIDDNTMCVSFPSQAGHLISRAIGNWKFIRRP